MLSCIARKHEKEFCPSNVDPWIQISVLDTTEIRYLTELSRPYQRSLSSEREHEFEYVLILSSKEMMMSATVSVTTEIHADTIEFLNGSNLQTYI